MAFVNIHQQLVFGVFALVLYLDVLVERTLRTIGFITLVDVAGVVPGYLDCRSTHTLLPLIVLGVGRLYWLKTVTPLIFGHLNPQLSAYNFDLSSYGANLSVGNGTWLILVRTSWCILAASR